MLLGASRMAIFSVWSTFQATVVVTVVVVTVVVEAVEDVDSQYEA